MKKIAVLLAVVFCATLMFAQDASKFELFGGYQLLNADTQGLGDRTNMSGWNTDLAARVAKNISLVADVSGNYKTESASFAGITAEGKVRVYNLLFGPRVSATTGKVTPFAEALLGLAHTSVSASAAGISADESSNNFGMAFGGGLDVNANKNIAIRVAKVDYLFNRVKNSDLGVSENLNHLRFSTGVVFKF